MAIQLDSSRLGSVRISIAAYDVDTTEAARMLQSNTGETHISILKAQIKEPAGGTSDCSVPDDSASDGITDDEEEADTTDKEEDMSAPDVVPVDILHLDLEYQCDPTDSRDQSMYKMTTTLLGSGAFADVWLATARNGRKVAIKVIEKTSNANDLSYLKEEHKLLVRMSASPHVARLISAWETSTTVYFVLQLCGGNLFECVRQAKVPYTERFVSKLLRDMLQAVSACHDFGVMHRDIKFENIVMSTDCSWETDGWHDSNANIGLLLVDFGVSTFFKVDQMLKEFAGSVYFIAPEVLPKDEGCYNKEADVWSCGIILYILLFGVRPIAIDATGDDYFLELTKRHADIATGVEPIDFTPDPLTGPSADAIEVVKSMLRTAPSERATIQQILGTPWASAGGTASDSRPLLFQSILLANQAPTKQQQDESECTQQPRRLTNTKAVSAQQPFLRKHVSAVFARGTVSPVAFGRGAHANKLNPVCTTSQQDYLDRTPHKLAALASIKTKQQRPSTSSSNLPPSASQHALVTGLPHQPPSAVLLTIKTNQQQQRLSAWGGGRNSPLPSASPRIRDHREAEAQRARVTGLAASQPVWGRLQAQQRQAAASPGRLSVNGQQPAKTPPVTPTKISGIPITPEGRVPCSPSSLMRDRSGIPQVQLFYAKARMKVQERQLPRVSDAILSPVPAQLPTISPPKQPEHPPEQNQVHGLTSDVSSSQQIAQAPDHHEGRRLANSGSEHVTDKEVDHKAAKQQRVEPTQGHRLTNGGGQEAAKQQSIMVEQPAVIRIGGLSTQQRAKKQLAQDAMAMSDCLRRMLGVRLTHCSESHRILKRAVLSVDGKHMVDRYLEQQQAHNGALRQLVVLAAHATICGMQRFCHTPEQVLLGPQELSEQLLLFSGEGTAAVDAATTVLQLMQLHDQPLAGSTLVDKILIIGLQLQSTHPSMATVCTMSDGHMSDSSNINGVDNPTPIPKGQMARARVLKLVLGSMAHHLQDSQLLAALGNMLASIIRKFSCCERDIRATLSRHGGVAAEQLACMGPHCWHFAEPTYPTRLHQQARVLATLHRILQDCKAHVDGHNLEQNWSHPTMETLTKLQDFLLFSLRRMGSSDLAEQREQECLGLK